MSNHLELPPSTAEDDPDSDVSASQPTPERRPSESSTERSEYDASVEDDLLQPTKPVPKPSGDPRKTLSFYRSSHTNLLIKDDASDTDVFFADASNLKPKRPDIILHAGGADKTGPVLGVARFRFSRQLQLGLCDLDDGDTSSEQDMEWTEMRNEHVLGHAMYRFEMDVGGDMRRGFEWTRTRSEDDGVESTAAKVRGGSYRLSDEASGEVLAVYLENGLKSWKKKGKLVVRSESVVGNVEVMVVLGLCGLIEKRRRRTHGWSGMSAGGGGGT